MCVRKAKTHIYVDTICFGNVNFCYHTWSPNTTKRGASASIGWNPKWHLWIQRCHLGKGPRKGGFTSCDTQKLCSSQKQNAEKLTVFSCPLIMFLFWGWAKELFFAENTAKNWFLWKALTSVTSPGYFTSADTSPYGGSRHKRVRPCTSERRQQWLQQRRTISRKGDTKERRLLRLAYISETSAPTSLDSDFLHMVAEQQQRHYNHHRRKGEVHPTRSWHQERKLWHHRHI